MKFKQIIKTVIFLAIFVILYMGVARVLEKRTSAVKYDPFFEQKENYQVLFMGTSHVTNGINPMEMYNDYGLISYNFGGHGNSFPTTYWVAMNALDYTTPELMVIDCSGLSEDKLHNDNIHYAHVSLDCFPLSPNKSKAIEEIFDGDDKTEFYCKMWIYHNRWSEIEKADFFHPRNYEKGAESRYRVSKKATCPQLPKGKYEGEGLGVEYLERLIEECQARNIKVLLTYLPLPYDEGKNDKKLLEANRVYDIAQKYSVNYVNYFELNLVDYATDYCDKIGHLNPSGARKVTKHLGQYIVDNYGLEDKREDKAYSQWKSDAIDFAEMKNKRIREEDKLDLLLMLLQDDDYSSDLFLYNNKVLEDEYYCGLLTNAGYSPESLRNEVEGSDTEMDVKVVVKNKQTGEELLSREYVLEEEENTDEAEDVQEE